jgi:type IV secretion system protein VirB9
MPALAADPRIRILPYDPDRVVLLTGVYGYELMIQFAADERIENVAIGDGTAWQVTPNKSADLLFLKPFDPAADTNMTVVTDKRSYLFQLTARPISRVKPGDLTYLVRFTYPPEPKAAIIAPPPPPAPPERRNIAYTYTGARELVPSEVFDDGRFTYFKWPESASAPAVFLLSKEGGENLVNSSFRDGYLVVEQVAQGFRLRNGKAVTTVINTAWRELSPGEAAPRPADPKSARTLLHDMGRP